MSESHPHPHCAVIGPVSSDVARPLWSVMIPTFHCARYLSQTLRAVLANDPGPAQMQIEVVDDHSTQDDPERVVQEIGRGRVAFHRQPVNLGHIGNFDTCLKRSRGRLVHLLHGDDLVRPDFYRIMARAFELEPSIGAAFCRHRFIDENDQELSVSPLEQESSGILDHWLERLSQEQRIMTPSIVVLRAAYERLGGFDSRLVCSEDWEMWIRIAAHFPIYYEIEPLAVYRMHLHSNTGRHIRTGEDISFTNRAIDLFSAYLPKEMASRVVPIAKQTYAFSALHMAEQMAAKRDWTAVRAQIRAALGCSMAPRVLARLSQVLLHSSKQGLMQLAGRSPHQNAPEDLQRFK